MGKSATVLGGDFGLTGREMNFVLKEEGFLDGEPGKYFVTEKGEKYATEQDYHRGPGGYAWYNRDYSVRTWDEEVTDELDLSEDRIRELRQAIKAAKQKPVEVDSEDNIISFSDYSYNDENTKDDDDYALAAAVGILILAVSTYGVYKAAPYIKRWWTEKAVPNINKLKSRVTGKTEQLAEETDEEPTDLKDE